MPRLFILFFCCLVSAAMFAQNRPSAHRWHPRPWHPPHPSHLKPGWNPRISLYVSDQLVDVLADETEGGNPAAMGKGLQFVYNNKSIFRPTVDLTADLYLGGDKVLYGDGNGVIFDNIGTMVNVFGGLVIQPTQWLSFSGVMGPSFTDSNITLGLKPSIGFNFGYQHRFLGKLSYVKVYNRERHTDTDFKSWTISFGYKIF